ncbi:uncharacterized protein DS421_16g533170 [Arachis hypogaea]|nr:uncharacterized protein DS421_16g533170 [Arachis hypogaea]
MEAIAHLENKKKKKPPLSAINMHLNLIGLRGVASSFVGMYSALRNAFNFDKGIFNTCFLLLSSFGFCLCFSKRHIKKYII